MAIDQSLLLADFARTCKAVARVVSLYSGTHAHDQRLDPRYGAGARPRHRRAFLREFRLSGLMLDIGKVEMVNRLRRKA